MSQRKPPPKIGAPAPELLPAVLESLLFVAEEPQEIAALARTVELPRQRVEQALEELAQGAGSRGLFVQRHGDRVQLATVPDAAPYIERFLEVEHGRLTRASLETLAIIAYRQPVTRATIEAIRGVNADHAVSMLLARELIEEVGRAPGPGRPVLFATTVRFLEYFGLRRPEDLPPLPPDPDAEPGPTAEEASGFIDSGPSSDEREGDAEPDTAPPAHLTIAGEAEAGPADAPATPEDAGDGLDALLPPQAAEAGRDGESEPDGTPQARDAAGDGGDGEPDGTPPARDAASDGESELEHDTTPPSPPAMASNGEDGQPDSEPLSPSPLAMASRQDEPPEAP